MSVVSNTSPILNLAIIDQLELLRQQFDQVVIPPAVLDELKTTTDLAGASAIRQALESGWLRVAELEQVFVSRILALELHSGEADAIALALELRAELVLMDEQEGRAKARALGLQPIGILGVLLRAKRQGQLDSVAAAMEALRQQAGFFIADSLMSQMLIEAGESRP